MCVIFFAYRVDPEHPLILLANRDEFYARPSAPADWWEGESDIYAGRDLISGGTWLGVTRRGRFAAVTNYREPSAPQGQRSRGELAADFLRSDVEPLEYLGSINATKTEFS